MKGRTAGVSCVRLGSGKDEMGARWENDYQIEQCSSERWVMRMDVARVHVEGDRDGGGR